MKGTMVATVSRRELDQYMTPDQAVEHLLDGVPGIAGRGVVEPCAGTGAITVALTRRLCHVLTNDLDPGFVTDYHEDATDVVFWDELVLPHAPVWAVTNPPFSYAQPILERALATCDNVAFFLRLSFLEPTFNRSLFFLRHGCPDRLIVLPRISFTGDGKTDSVTCAWMIWSSEVKKGIDVIGKFKGG